MDDKLRMVGLVGSLRQGSYNRALMEAAKGLLPQEAELEVLDFSNLPIFNQDLESSPPESVKEFKAKIKAADAVLFATPEYNYSIPGGLKNAIDWASRPYGDNSWEGKPAGLMGASGGMVGTARAQYHLRQVFVFLNIHPLNRPEIMVPFAATKFDKEGRLIDEETKGKLAEFLKALMDWTRQLRK